MKRLIIQHSAFIGWLLLAVYILLIGAGLWLQAYSGMSAAGYGTPVPFIPIMLTSWSIVGAVLVSRIPRHPVGWIFLTMPIVFGLGDFTAGYAYYGYVARPGSLPFVEAAIVYAQYISGRTLSTSWITLLFLLFPTGRPMSRRWGLLARAAIIFVILYAVSGAISPSPLGNRSSPFPLDVIAIDPAVRQLVLPINLFSFFGIVFCAALATGSLYLRLHRSSGVERQQLKWFVYVSTFFVPAVCLILIEPITNSPTLEWTLLSGILLGGVMLAGVPVASAFAILRYRLWDIDIIIRRTLIYSLLTGLLALIFLSIVTLLQSAATSFTGLNSQFAIVLTTLFIAALFNPLRVRVQDAIDRRFYRRAYNADRILQAYARTIQAEVDLTALAHKTLQVAGSTMQPEKLSLWLRTE